MILSLVAIVGAAAVALFCDYLRHRNQQLREAMVELKVRRRQNELNAALAGARQPEVEAAPSAPVPERPPLAEAPAPVLHEPSAAATALLTERPPNEEKPLVRVSQIAAKPASPVPAPAAASLEFTSRKGKRRVEPAEPTPAAGQTEDDSGAKQALSEWLIKRAMARAAEKAACEPTLESPGPAPQSPEPHVVAISPVEKKHEQPVIEAPKMSDFGTNFEPVVIDEFLWRSLFSAKVEEPRHEPAVVPEPSEPPKEPEFAAVHHHPPAAADLMVPGGFHEVNALDALIQSDRLFSGLVVSIGVSQADPRAGRNEELMRSIAEFVQQLLQPADFACQISEEEFLLISPGTTGMDAQRKLSGLSERFWDYQLRALGTFSILFSLGGAEAQKEALEGAISLAKERMQQTKRSRKSIVTMTPQPRRKAV